MRWLNYLRLIKSHIDRLKINTCPCFSPRGKSVFRFVSDEGQKLSALPFGIHQTFQSNTDFNKPLFLCRSCDPGGAGGAVERVEVTEAGIFVRALSPAGVEGFLSSVLGCFVDSSATFV